MNFWSERATAEEAYTSRQKSLTTFMDLVAFIALGSMVFFGQKIISESLWLSNHPDHVPEYLKKLAQPFEARIYGNSQGDSLQYCLLKPLDYNSTKKYPLVVCLHGSSGRGTDNAKQVLASLPARLLSTKENRAKYPAFLFVSQCPPETVWGGISNLPAVNSLVFETIFALEEEFPIDENRRYVAGNSLGGYGTWYLICTRPELFAAAIPISGGAILHWPKILQICLYGLSMERKIEMCRWVVRGISLRRSKRRVAIPGTQSIRMNVITSGRR